MTRTRFGTEKKAFGIQVHRGPLATIYACPACKHIERAPLGPGQGRGHGLRTGGGCYSRMTAHIRREHPEVPE